MRKFHQQKSNKIMGVSRTAIVALTAILAGGGAFAAVGGTESVRQMFVTLRMAGPDGDRVQELVIGWIGETDEPSAMNFELGDEKNATVKIEHLESDDADGVAASTFQIQLGIDDEANNQAFFTNEVAGVEGVTTTIEIQMGDDNTSAGPSVTLNSLSPSDSEVMKVMALIDGVDVTKGNGSTALNDAIQRMVNFPSHMDTFELDEADTIHSWADEDGVTYDLVLHRVQAEDGQGDIYLFKAYKGEKGQRVYDSIGQMNGIDPELLDVTDVQMNGDKITICFDNDGSTLKMILNADSDAKSFGKKTITIEATE